MALIDAHPLYTYNKDLWELVRDACKGQKAIKAKTTDYLPDFVPSQGDTRYNAYLTRALYSNYTGRTKDRLIGSIFRKPATAVLPSQLEYMMKDATATGLSLEQFAKSLCEDVFETGRGGILVDYPEAEGNESKEVVAKKNLLPRLAAYKAEAIFNWQSTWIDGKEFLTQVRLEEMEENILDEFTSEFVTQYRVLDLYKKDPESNTPAIYRQRIYDQKYMLIKEFFPTAGGKTLDHIPFYFVGSSNNASTVDISPLYDLAIINIAHYRNSADYEDGCYKFGRPTLFITSEMSAEQFKEANSAGIIVGGDSGHFLGANGNAILIQMEANKASQEAMKAKEEQMSAFGAALFEFQGQNQTAEEARIKATSESNTLNIIVDNVSESIESALKDAALFVGANPETIEYELNKEFFPIEITTGEISSYVALVEKGIIGLTDLREKLRKTEAIDPERTDQDLDADSENLVRDEIKKDKEQNDNNSI